MGEFLAKLLGFLGVKRTKDDFQEEIEEHLESIAEGYVARGMSPEAARDAARREFGNPTRVAEQARESWTFQFGDALMQDLRLALRGMRRAPVLSAVIVATLGLGIGANTAIFSVVHGILIEPLPYPDADRLVWLGESTQKSPGISVTWVNYQHWTRDNHSFESLAGFAVDHKIATGGREPALIRTAVVTSGLLPLIGMKPQSGRLLGERDDVAGAPPVVVLSDTFWRRHFGADSRILNSTLALDGKAYQVVGIAEPVWQFFNKESDVFLPLGPSRVGVTDRSQHGSMRVLGRLKPGVTMRQAQADLDQIMDRLATAEPGPENGHHSFTQLLSDKVTTEVRQSLWALMAASGLLLLIACGNVAGLLVARNLARHSEMAIRMAIGAGRGRLIRQLVTESLVFAFIGGAGGVVMAYWCTTLLRSAAPLDIPRLATMTVRGEVLAFAVLATLITGLIAGLAPVWSAQRGIHLAEAMQGMTRSASSNKRSVSMRAGLVAAQIAITLVLVFVSVALLRSLAAAQNRDPGFEPARLWAMELILPDSEYRSGQAIWGFYDQLRENIAALPGVESVALVNGPPALGARMDWFYSIAGKPTPKQGEVPTAVLNFASPGFFSMAHIAVRAGREFTAHDRKDTPCVAIVNRELARDQLAVGDSIKIGGPYTKGSLCQVVGIAGDVSQEGLDSRVAPEIYMPFAQSPTGAMALMIRARGEGDSDSLARQIRGEVARLGPGVPIQSLHPVTELLASTLDRRRFGTLLLASFAGLALALAAIGIYGLLDFWVGMRRQEIALRLALGASRSAILKLTGWQTARLVLAGCALGVGAAYAASRWMANLVYGISANDASTLAISGFTMLLLGCVASAIPLWRAVRVSEAEQLHRY